VAAVLLALAAAGCGGGKKMTADQLEAWLSKGLAPGVHVACRRGGGSLGDWDYSCTFSGAGHAGSRRENTYGYNVNEHRPTDYSF
jgi:hypothetical protein